MVVSSGQTLAAPRKRWMLSHHAHARSLVISGPTTLKAGTTLNDQAFRGTYASGIVLDGCTLQQVSLNLGPSRTIRPV